MGPVRVTARLLTSLMTLLVVTSLLPSTLGCKDTSICRFSCCTAVPNCDEAKQIDCVCPVLDEMILTPDSIPAGTTSLSISKVSNLTIGGHSFHRLNSLIHFTVSDIGAVIIGRKGMSLHPKNVLRIFIARRVESLNVDEHGLTGKWQTEPEQTTIIFEEIKELNIASRGLSYATSESDEGLTVRISNIATLSLASKAFDARIRDLLLENVSMPQCHMGTFENKIHSLELNKVTILDVKTRCFNSVGEHGNGLDCGVHITNSTLGTVKSQAFSGNITNIKLDQKTLVGKVNKHGFQVQAKDFIVKNSKIDTLSSKSLSVTCKKTFAIKDVSIGRLRTDAFKDVRAVRQSVPTVSLESLEVGVAEPGSLSFQRCLCVDASKLHIQLSDEEKCPTEQWARRILGVTDQQALYWEIRQLYQSLRESSSGCDKNGEPQLTTAVEDESCPYPDDAEEVVESGVSGEETSEGVISDEKRPSGQNETGSSGGVSACWKWAAIVLMVVVVVAVVAVMFALKMCTF
ncbi:uncharacterized protein LOC122371155 [Amphibalanus amphitrite]|uniref:uncharacterized protein LOC122371155 n=1 Tax=Amphibalanus amphitrite TaxID=1232801 RepID=UPI001C913CEA|nr:uncharacterized protein LOC122371155 [Amphibalanus amphitrite]